jgi:regulator of protease activity HflC (stomatin/prohibitin superfamily)
MTALVGLILQAAFLLTCVIVADKTHSRAASAESWYVGAGLLVWFVVLVHGRQRRLARQEREERERLRESRLSDEIFQETELDAMRASAGLLIFEKYLVPLFSIILSGLLGFFAYRIASTAWVEPAWTIKKPAAVGIGMIAIAFFGYLMGKYAAAMAQNRGFRLLRAAGGYVLGNVITAVLVAVAMAMYYFGVTWGERVMVYVIPTVMALVAVEVLLNLVLDVYRPRVEGQEARPPYDSRLLGLFAEPEGVLRTVAATLDYQFGFKVSETWFYRFMERAILPLLLVQLASLWLLTSLVVVDQDEIVFIETLGRPHLSEQEAERGVLATVFHPGFHLKAPWPISVARHVPAARVHRLEVGKIRDEHARLDRLIKVMETPDVVLWRERHIHPEEGFEASFLVPSTADVERAEEPAEPEQAAGAEAVSAEEPAAVRKARKAPHVNLARLAAHVYYRVKQKPDGSIDENAAFTFHYRQSDIQRHVEKLAYRAICRIAASQDFIGWVADEREEVVAQFGRMMREAVEQADLGLEVVQVTIPAVHPPAEVARAYEAVVAALERKESLIHEGEQVSIRTRQVARARRAEILSAAEAYRYVERTVTEAEADLFLVQLSAYERVPRVYMFRTYFNALEEALSRQKVFVVPETATEVQIIDLQEKLRAQLLEGLDVLEEMEE